MHVGHMKTLPFDIDFGECPPRPDPTGCPPFEIAPPAARQEGSPHLGGTAGRGSGAQPPSVVHAVDFGLSEASERNQDAINAALAEARRVGAARVELAPGTYRCFDGGGIVIEGFRDFTFDGCGATLVFRSPPRLPIEPSWDHDGSGANFIVRDCRRVRIGNFAMDWDWRAMPLATCARVAAVHIDEAADNASYVDFELLGHGGRHPYFGRHFPVQHVQPMTDDFRHFTHGEHIWQGTYEGDMGCKAEWLSPTRVRVWPSVEAPGLPRWRGPNEREFSPAENRRNAAAIPAGQSCRIAHAYYGKGGFTLFSNEDFELHDVEVRACFGHAVYVGGTQRNWRLRDVTVAPRDLRHPISSTADTVHFVRSCGNAVIDNLAVRLEQDDALNAHDRFTVARRIAPRTLEVVLARGARYFRPGAGDAVELLDPGYNATGWTGVCTAAAGETVEVDRDLPEATPPEGYFLLLDRTASSDGLIVRNCTFEDMEMRVLVNVSDATIENCVFRRTNGDALRCIADYTFGQWAEGMGAKNIVVRNCRFEGNCVRELVGEYWSLGADFATWLGHPAEVAPERLNSAFVSDILVEGCSFVDSLGYFADLRAGTGITFRNNRIELTGTRARCRETAGSARIEGARGVRFEGNEFILPAGVPAPRLELATAGGSGAASGGSGAQPPSFAVVLQNNRISRRAGWPGGTQATTTNGESRERQKQGRQMANGSQPRSAPSRCSRHGPRSARHRSLRSAKTMTASTAPSRPPATDIR